MHGDGNSKKTSDKEEHAASKLSWVRGFSESSISSGEGKELRQVEAGQEEKQLKDLHTPVGSASDAACQSTVCCLCTAVCGAALFLLLCMCACCVDVTA